jgi:transcriptional regulator GlxA family with amidase domain
MKIANFTIGIVMLEAYQLLDVAGPVEIIHMAGRKYLSNIPPVPPQAPNIAVHWIGPSLNANVNVTSDARTFPTATFDRYPKLDVLFIPGVPPSYVAPPEIVKFMNRAAKEARIVMSDCTGPLVLAQLGLLDGKNATLNNGLGPLARQLYPKVNWQEGVRWVIDGKTWTGAGAVSSMSMAVAFLESGKFGDLGDLPQVVAKLIELEPKGRIRETVA